MISKALDNLIAEAERYSRETESSSTDLVHILLSLLDDTDVQTRLMEAGIDYADAREQLVDHLERRDKKNASDEEDKLSPLATFVLDQACSKSEYVSPADLVDMIGGLGFIPEDDYYAVRVLKDLALDRRAEQRHYSQSDLEFLRDILPGTAAREPIPEVLSAYCTDLVAQARNGQLDNVYGREKEIARLIEILGRKKKSNPILLGEPGVGKTAIVEGLAARIAANRAGSSLANARIYALDVTRMVAGTRNRGDFEERLKALVDALSDNRRRILFIDEAHVLLGGASGASDAANLLKPALASSRIRCIGATTHGEYFKYFGNDPAMARRFQPIDVQEPTRAEAKMLMRKVVQDLSDYHLLEYEDGAVEAAVDLTARFVVDRRLPDKAIDVLDEAGSVAASRDLSSVPPSLVREIVSRMSGVPLGGSGTNLDVGATLSRKIKGQPEACSEIAKAVRRADTGMGKENRARLSLVFGGRPGTGKRHAATVLAEIRDVPITTFNMAEFREPYSITRLIGSPPGYIGYGQGGQMTEAARRTPACIMVFESIESAHPEVVTLVMQAVETGRMTDSTGRTVSFAGVTFVFLWEPKDGENRPIGFSASAGEEEDTIPASLKNAVDAVIRFRSLDKRALKEIAAELASDLKRNLALAGTKLVMDEAVLEAVADHAAANGGTGRSTGMAFRKLIEDAVFEAGVGDGETIRLTFASGSIAVDRNGITRRQEECAV